MGAEHPRGASFPNDLAVVRALVTASTHDDFEGQAMLLTGLTAGETIRALGLACRVLDHMIGREARPVGWSHADWFDHFGDSVGA